MDNFATAAESSVIPESLNSSIFLLRIRVCVTLEGSGMFDSKCDDHFL